MLRISSQVAAESGATSVRLQGLLEVSLLRDSKTPHIAPGWHRYWCVLAGCCVYLYTSPQSAYSVGLIALVKEHSSLVNCGKHLNPSRGGAIQLRHVSVNIDGVQYKSALLAAASWEETSTWAEALRIGVGQDYTNAPDLDMRTAALAPQRVMNDLPLERTTIEALRESVEGGLVLPDLSWAGFRSAQSIVLERAQAVESPFADDLEEGLTVWVVSRGTLRRVGGAPPALLKADRAYVMLCASPTSHESVDSESHMALELHHWAGSHASADAAGAAAVFTVHLLQASGTLGATSPTQTRSPTLPTQVLDPHPTHAVHTPRRGRRSKARPRSTARRRGTSRPSSASTSTRVSSPSRPRTTPPPRRAGGLE